MNLMTTKQVAAKAGKSVSTICRWVEEGRISPVIKNDGLRQPMFFDPEDVDALLSPAEPSEAAS